MKNTDTANKTWFQFDFDDFSVKLLLANALFFVAFFLAYLAFIKK